MKNLLRALSADILKLKRTLALWLVVLAPLVVTALQFLNYLQRGEYLIPVDANPWRWMAQNVLILWGIMMLPLFVALETALLAGLEHNNNQWKHIYALPISRWQVYLARLLVNFTLAGLGTLLLWLWILIAGWGLRLLKPGLGFEIAPPTLDLLLLAAATYLAAWMLIAIHTWISTRWPSFTLAIGSGIVGLFGGFMIANTSLWRIYPWSLPGNIENIIYQNLYDPNPALSISTALISLGFSIIGGILIAIAGAWDIARRDVL